MKLSDTEKRELIRLIENGKSIPEEYRFKIFEDKDEIELLWDGKSYNISNVNLPFQTIEHIEEPREEKKIAQADLFEKKQRDWTNKLIWGNNSLILSSLINGSLRKQIENEGGIKLIYIDPPFNVGDDFEFEIPIGNQKLNKKRNALEQLAFSDTWGKQEDSFLSMLYERLKLMKTLLADNGVIFVHCDWRLNSSIRMIMSELFGYDNYINEVVWKRQTAHSDYKQGSKHLGRITDNIFIYAKNFQSLKLNNLFTPYDEDYIKKNFKHSDNDGRLYSLGDLTGPGGASKGNPKYKFLGVERYWAHSKENMEKMYKEGKIVQTKPGTVPRRKRYLDEMPGVALQNLWTDINPIQSHSKEKTYYPTQKPEALLKRIIELGSNENDLIADFFCGSGTTLSVAEKLNRKWIGSDLGKFAIHTSRKRLIQVQRDKKLQKEKFRPFEILNLGKYQREFFVKDYLFENRQLKQKGSEEHYYSIILEAYKSKKIENYNILRGIKNNRFTAIGPFNLQVTRLFAEKVIAECISNKITKVDILGFEFEMGLFPNIRDFAKSKNVDLNCLLIPAEVFDGNAVKKNQIIFYNTAFIDAEIKYKNNKEFFIRMNGYSIFDSDNLFEETLEGMENGQKREILMNNSIIKIQKDKKGKINKEIIKMKWKNWIDYWAVDFDFESKQEIITKDGKDEWTGDYIFENEWQDFRTLNHDIDFDSRPEKIDKTKKIAVKVVDIFGNDTMKILKHKND